MCHHRHSLDLWPSRPRASTDGDSVLRIDEGMNEKKPHTCDTNEGHLLWIAHGRALRFRNGHIGTESLRHHSLLPIRKLCDSRNLTIDRRPPCMLRVATAVSGESLRGR